jgi:hypothetical protein
MISRYNNMHWMSNGLYRVRRVKKLRKACWTVLKKGFGKNISPHKLKGKKFWKRLRQLILGRSTIWIGIQGWLEIVFWLQVQIWKVLPRKVMGWCLLERYYLDFWILVILLQTVHWDLRLLILLRTLIDWTKDYFPQWFQSEICEFSND